MGFKKTIRKGKNFKENKKNEKNFFKTIRLGMECGLATLTNGGKGPFLSSLSFNDFVHNLFSQFYHVTLLNGCFERRNLSIL